eukprot:TRINITY_DN21978_c0_g1_i2.p1 TRINITY_DN21978_c0_g1~~TRINITY_DN21978_c0_g1_i2.p1  ORF type:complete len:161 (-),score=25.87 TRINITY_DN21978_c0_g1_i2:58-540(-)
MRKVRRGYATLGHRLSEMSSLRECIKSMMVVDCGATPPGATCYRCFGGAYCDWRYVNVNDPVPRVLDRKLRALREELVRDANAYTQVGEECVLQQGPIEQVCALTDEALDLSTGCLLYTSDAADEEDSVDLGGRRIIKKKKRKNRDKKGKNKEEISKKGE